MTEIEKYNHITGKGQDRMNDQEAIEIKGSSFALLVKNLEQTVKFYTDLGFTHEVIGSKVQHHHVSRDKLTLILLEAREEDEVKPISSRYEEQYFDVYCYTNAVDLLAQEIMDKPITIVRKPHYTSHWSEFTFRDLNGYQITIGGGVINKDLIAE
ncbi:VOC family protein [Paenibacillus ginsengarvi]|uniref:VOC family protein n=1 Tax=Paenibacillus ginsengarvi TaxID=400777 RepID=A0A3B0CLN2_9BACL|nr:VOC family protein [Paenibacillus ginsengarvi]RKN85771.1 VOC family protein [Paenibacillus ginsengarvi]